MLWIKYKNKKKEYANKNYLYVLVIGVINISNRAAVWFIIVRPCMPCKYIGA